MSTVANLKRFFLLISAVCILDAAPKTTNIAQLPISFEPNKGQEADGAQFIARGTGYYLTLGSAGSRMLLRNDNNTADIRMSLVNASQTTPLQGENLLPGHSSYFRGNNASQWVTNLANFATVKADAVYPGIDLIYYGNQSHLEYDFTVAPQADPNKIRLRFTGLSGLKMTGSGDLLLQSPAGNLVQRKPVVYQTLAGTRRSIPADFKLLNATDVAFSIGSYDHSLPLVIDPVLVYSGYLGGRDIDAGNSVATDPAGNMYLAGITFSTLKGDADVLLRKISADGTAFLYSADLGGAGNDYGNSIAVDVNGSAYVGGRTSSVDFPIAAAFQEKNYGVNNAYVLRLDPAATTLLFSTYLGGSKDDRGYAIALDSQGSVYVTGASTSNDFPTNDAAFQRGNKGGVDAFVTKFTLTGAAVYSTLLGGGSDDKANGIAVDNGGNVYLAGDTYSDSFPQANPPYQHSRHGSLDAFAAELNPDGSQLVFSTFSGGSGDDSASGVAVDLSGNVYLVGSTTGDKGFDTPGHAYNDSYNGGDSDIFVSKYTASGKDLAWTTFLGSHGGDYGNGITVDPNGNVYVIGDTDSNQFPVTRDAVQPNRGGGVDAVLSVLDTNGANLLYSTFYGGSGDDSAYAIALDQFYEVLLTGGTSSPDLAISQGVVQRLPGGGESDAFVAKISLIGSSIPGAILPPPVMTVPAESSVSSAFGPSMIVPETEGRFDRSIQGSGASVNPDRFERMGRPGKSRILR